MVSITKKRTAAFLMDAAISTAFTLGVEYFLRKKVKNEAVHALVTPTVVLWTLEYAQLRKKGQTLGYKAMGLTLENEDGRPLSDGQIVKRMVYRDTLSMFDYLKSRQAFVQQHGQRLPHDNFAGTVVKEK
ncbi:RDD family protein [Lysinibacillus sp. ZYM-1]|uniref:RDD family protein n=1 Tax=Lysinibacillus sp. ZYM-1 TaxID=1681184 RepID=UPI0006CE95B1|nr:RDD family protein [Lysinibacillus sp. ZYM-1]KPN94875.1 RDD family protein [Lysinibacillus sp. ZYM-1]